MAAIEGTSVKIKGDCPVCGHTWIWATPAEVLQFCPQEHGASPVAKVPLAHSVIIGAAQIPPQAPEGIPLMATSKQPFHVTAAKAKAKAKATLPPKPTASKIHGGTSLALVAKTQKAKGIQTLQGAGILPKDMAYVALDIAQAMEAASKLTLPCFVRPCPITPRHGFVESRVVKSMDEITQVWQEAKAQDPQAELILMPFVEATHNMVWRPGLLSVGPGHDGATGGHDSVSIFLEPDYSQHWKGLAKQAGCNLETSTPFLEAVCSNSHTSVITQIRAGDNKTPPTAPDWCPYDDYIVTEVAVIDPAHKSDAGAMLEWETTAKLLGAKLHAALADKLPTSGPAVYNPGGNLGDHWSVHARLHGIPVATTFKPQVSAVLPKIGESPVPLNPNAIVYGYLGGLLAPSLMLPVMRERAVCCSLLGSHHGLRMGGDAGVFLGTSVAMMLRLAQAALWGEARHKDGGKGLKPKGQSGKLSRDQIFTAILDDWMKGRLGLEAKGSIFLTHSWSSGYGGPAWAVCAGATADLDGAMLDLIRQPSEAQAKQVVATLTNVVNLAHNNGWWLNKFVQSHIFDMAADLDPRVAILAGPIWYEATKVGADKRIKLLEQIVTLPKVDMEKYGLSKVAHKAKLAKPSTVHSMVGGTGSAHSPKAAPYQPSYQATPVPPPPGTKLGSLANAQWGGQIEVPKGTKIVHAQGTPKAEGLHVQLKTDKGYYYSAEALWPEGTPDYMSKVYAALAQAPQVGSLAKTSSMYAALTVEGSKITIGGSLSVVSWAESAEADMDGSGGGE